MPIDKVNPHYSFENPATVYDEEAVTALELAARTAAKVNECVEEVNRIPENIEAEIFAQINFGSFDKQIDNHTKELTAEIAQTEMALTQEVAAAEARFETEVNELNRTLTSRVDNLLGSVTAGSTTGDAELIDGRTGADGVTHSNIGEAIRTGLTRVNQIAMGSMYVGNLGTVDIVNGVDTGNDWVKITISRSMVFLFHGLKADLPWADITTNITEYVEISGNACTITHPLARGSLVFNYLDKQLYFRAADNIQYGDFVLLVNSWGNAVDGWLFEEYCRQQATKGLAKTREVLTDMTNGSFYVSNKRTVALTGREDSSGAYVDVLIGGKLCGLFHGIKKVYEWTDICSELPAERYAITADSLACTISVGYRQVLVFDTQSEKLLLKQGDNIAFGDFLMLSAAYTEASGGWLYDISLERRLDALEVVAGSGNIQEASPAVHAHAARFIGSSTVEPFMFFTDPHLCQKWEEWVPLFNTYMDTCHDMYKQSAADLVFCGGDWLGNNDTREEAAYKLGYIYARMRDMFGDNYCPILGNHDTNYQGVVNVGETNTGTLSQAAINNLYFAGGNSYYTVDGRATRFIVLDTGVEWNDGMTDYRLNQLDWVANVLRNNDADNLAIMAHIFRVSSESTVPAALANCVTGMCDAFNRRTAYTFSGRTYDFTGCTGRVRFAMFGHNHKDEVTSYNNIPVIITADLRNGGVPTFDLCAIDYNANKLYLDRVGTGSSREVNI